MICVCVCVCVCVRVCTVHTYGIIFEGGIAVWEGPIACTMFAQFLKTNLRPCGPCVFRGLQFCGGSCQKDNCHMHHMYITYLSNVSSYVSTCFLPAKYRQRHVWPLWSRQVHLSFPTGIHLHWKNMEKYGQTWTNYNKLTTNLWFTWHWQTCWCLLPAPRKQVNWEKWNRKGK